AFARLGEPPDLVGVVTPEDDARGDGAADVGASALGQDRRAYEPHLPDPQHRHGGSVAFGGRVGGSACGHAVPRRKTKERVRAGPGRGGARGRPRLWAWGSGFAPRRVRERAAAAGRVLGGA